MALHMADAATAVASAGESHRRVRKSSPRGDRDTGQDEWNQDDLIREWRRLRWLLDRAEETADGIARMLEARGIDAFVRPRVVTTPTKKKRRACRYAGRHWELMARPGVGRLAIGDVMARRVSVSIDDAKEFLLTPALADLLAELAAGVAGDDGFPAFRTYPELASALTARTGRTVGVRAVVVGIGRLRGQLLEKGGVSPKLVETAPRKGARFRVRRRTS